MSRLSRWALIAVVLSILSGCATNTMTGRSQLMLVSEEHAISGSASAYLTMIGRLASKKRIEQGTARVERVREITNRLIAEAVRFRPDSATWHWEVQVIDDPKVVNAFCMAGGKMGIYTGFWEKLNATDDEIAAVMGHEIGHALASHTREKMSVGLAAGLGANLLAALVAGRSTGDPYAFQRAQGAFSLAADVAVTLPNSREAELEADQIGIELAARAGFDPRAAVTLWEKMAREGGARLEFLSTHPAPENRMQRLNALIAKVDPLYQRAKETESTAAIPTFLGINRNERVVGSLAREEYAARVAAEPEALTFISEEFERFTRGETEFSCTTRCVLSYTFRKSGWATLHRKQAWRDLAVAVSRVGYDNDLSYFLLGEAAMGLGLKDAARTYYARAAEARKAGRTCATSVSSCAGFEIGAAAHAAN